MSKRKLGTVPLEEDATSDWVNAKDQSSSLFTPSPKPHPKPMKRGRPFKKSSVSASLSAPSIPFPGPFFEQEQALPGPPPIAPPVSQGMKPSRNEEQPSLTLQGSADRVSQVVHMVSQDVTPDTESSPMLIKKAEDQTFKRRRLLADEKPKHFLAQTTTQPSLSPSQEYSQLSSAFPHFIHPISTVPQFHYEQPTDFYRLSIVPSSNNQRPALPMERIVLYKGSGFTIPECTLICALRMFVRHGNTGECLDDDTAAEVLKAFREGFGDQQNIQRSETPDCHGLFDYLASNHHKGGYVAELWTDLSRRVDHWHHIATRFWWDWIYYMDDLCRRCKLNNRLVEFGTMINDEHVLQRFNAVYENDQQIEFRPQHMPMPTLTAEELQNKREMQVLMQRRVQMQQWKQQQAIQAQLAQQLGTQVPVTLCSTPIPSAPEPTQRRQRTARQMAIPKKHRKWYHRCQKWRSRCYCHCRSPQFRSVVHLTMD
ncbi:hypothetical protein N7G274_010846 [Stereocaulon virgatum]|uniref:Uncharacterized protein n=1 Tax=Stereocaulon virgatum TaxID=373712 RepID=A0ABR3ZTT6_9LECA